MASQFERPFQDVVADLPELCRIERFDVPETVDCVVSILGFERRCLAAANELAERGVRATTVVGVKYANKEMDESNFEHESEWFSTLQRLGHGKEPKLLTHDDHNLGVDFGDLLLARLKSVDLDLDAESTHVVFDITVGSSRLLLEGLHALLNTRARLTIVYSESPTYRPRFDEYLALRNHEGLPDADPPEFLTQGVDKVEVLRRIPGHDADSRPTFLVVFPAFACTRVSAVIEELCPSKVQWMFGVPHTVENRWRIDAQREYHGALIEKSHRHCYVSTFDYRETLSVLESVYRKRRQAYGIFVCSLGSKLQKLGQAIFHLLRPEVAALVSIPRVWNPEKYSDERPRAVYVLDLGSCQRFRERLWSTRRLRL